MGINISASRVSELCPKDGSKSKTAQSYILDLAMECLGIKDSLDTQATRHGLVNQFNAFEFVVKPRFEGAVWHDEYMPIDDRCGASPDVLIGNVPMDIKCPYTPDKYFELFDSLPKCYVYQLQMQMIATGAENAYLLPYCTRPETFGDEVWEEYPIPLEERFRIIEVKKSDEIQSEIMLAVDKWHPKKIELIEMLKNAEEIGLERYFFESKGGAVYRKLKDANNIWMLDKVYRMGNEFYYYKRS